jgi:hypothetical protein
MITTTSVEAYIVQKLIDRSRIKIESKEDHEAYVFTILLCLKLLPTVVVNIKEFAGTLKARTIK